MQVKLFCHLIWTANCTQFLLENHLHGCQIFGWYGIGLYILCPNPNPNRISDIRTPLVHGWNKLWYLLLRHFMHVCSILSLTYTISEYCKTLIFRCILISRFWSVENSRHFNFAFFAAYSILLKHFSWHPLLLPLCVKWLQCTVYVEC